MRLVRRKDWQARHPRSVSVISTPTPKLVLHQFGTNAWTGPEGMRKCQNFHMDDPDRRYHDIAYSSMVDAGAVYEGRGAGVAGAHTAGWNTKAHAVAAAIDGSSYVPDGVVDRLAEAAVWLWRQGAVEAPAYTDGHRDLGQTACPGDQLYALIPEINRRAALLAEHGEIVTLAQAVVVPKQEKHLWDRPLGAAIAQGYALALVESDEDGNLTHEGKPARITDWAEVVGGGTKYPASPNAHRIAGGDRWETARAVFDFIRAHDPDEWKRRGRPYG